MILLRANPVCIRCRGKATICDHDPPVRAHTIAMVCCAGRSSQCAGRATAELQAILDQCPAPWWDPATLWDKAKDRTAAVFADYHPGAAHPLLGQAA